MSQTAKPTYIDDDRLTFRARGLLHALLADPDQPVSAVSIAARSTEGRDAIRTALRELQETGYLTRTRVQDECGRWSVQTDLHESAQ